MLAALSLFAISCRPAAPPVQEEESRPEIKSVSLADTAPVEKTAPETKEERVARVHREAVVMDTHCDTLMKVLDDGIDLGKRQEEGHIDFPRAKEGGLDVQVFAIWVGPEYWPDKAKKRALDMIDAFDATVTANPNDVVHVRTVKEARQVVHDGKLAAFLGIEGGHAIEDDVSNLKLFADRGVRYMTLTWWNNTNWADGSGDKPKHGGLSEKGKEIVREMNRLGMIVDISHAADTTFYDALEVTTKPVIASHSDTRVLSDHHRNMDDDMLRALAKNGGVIGINFVAGFLDTEFRLGREELKKKLAPEFKKIDAKYPKGSIKARKERWRFLGEESRKLPPVSIDKVIDHIDHAVKIAGIDHVGIGSDFDGFGVGPAELVDCSKLPMITGKLLDRGYSEEDIHKLMGGNFLRVFEANEQ